MPASPPLPGGVLREGVRVRDYAFRAMDGALELAIVDAVARAMHTPDAITRVLACALTSLAGQPPTRDGVAALCVADRQVLMHELQARLDLQRTWFSADCAACNARFDMRIDALALPVKPAGESFPCADVRCEGHVYGVRVPDGADQAWLAARGDASGDAAARALAARLIASMDGEAVASFPAEDVDDALLAAIDAALDDMAPEFATQAAAQCPECGTTNTVALDPYGVLAFSGAEVLDEVHLLASHYHWSERDILAMPRSRRYDYLVRVDAALGLAS